MASRKNVETLANFSSFGMGVGGRALQQAAPYRSWFRFSFGPLLSETFASDVALLGRVLEEYRAEVG